MSISNEQQHIIKILTKVEIIIFFSFKLLFPKRAGIGTFLKERGCRSFAEPVLSTPLNNSNILNKERMIE